MTDLSAERLKMAVAEKTLVTVKLFYDVVSPYTWLAFEVLCRYRQKWSLDLKLRPFYLSGIMKGSENRSPFTVPAKAAYIMKELPKLGNMYKVPFNDKLADNVTEAIFVKGSLQAGLFLTAVDMNCKQYLEELTRQFFMRIFNTGEDITEPESLLSAATRAGMPENLARQLITSTSDRAVKDRFRQTTQEALGYGAFGSPTIVAHVDGTPHMFFGSDRFELMAHVLGEKWEGPVPEVPQAKL